MNILDDIKQQYKFGGITQKLIFWNIGLFLVSLVFYEFSIGRFIYPTWLALSSNAGISFVFPWTFITYSFLHGGALHLIFNLIVLNFAGRLFQTFFSEKQLFGVYILGAIFSGLIYVFSSTFFLQSNAILVGASASIMTILFATVTYAPLMKVRLLLIGYVKLWHIALVFLLVDLLYFRQVINRYEDVDNILQRLGGRASHLSGALFGFLFVVLLKRGTDVTKIISKITDFVTGFFSKKPKKKYTPFKEVHINKKTTSKTSPKFEKDKNQQQIDEILDKISRSGYDSLTKEEKDFLFKQK